MYQGHSEDVYARPRARLTYQGVCKPLEEYKHQVLCGVYTVFYIFLNNLNSESKGFRKIGAIFVKTIFFSPKKKKE